MSQLHPPFPFSAPPPPVQIVMEYCGAGSVSDIMTICEVTLTEAEIADVMAATLIGLKYLHSMKLIHRVRVQGGG